MKILIYGASGVGKTSLARTLARNLNCFHLDLDEYYWKKTDIPFQDKVPVEIRNRNVIYDFARKDRVVLSGSPMGWDDFWFSAFDIAFLLIIPHKVRMERLRKREVERYGSTLISNPNIMEQSNAFLQWAAGYDDPFFEDTNCELHKAWANSMQCDVIEIEGELSMEKLEEIVITYLKEK